MKKIFKRLLNKKGISLIEIIVALAVTSVILLIATGMMRSTNSLLSTLKVNAHMDVLCDTANEYIRGCLQNATKISVYKYDATTLSAIETQAESYINSGSKVRALAVLEVPVDTDDSGNDINAYRLFDFPAITDKTNFMSDLSIADVDTYGAFLEPFYEKTSYSVELTSQTGDAGVAKWIKVKSVCNNIYTGDRSNQDKVMTFKCLGGSTPIETSTVDPYNGAFVILYTVKDFSSITA